MTTAGKVITCRAAVLWGPKDVRVEDVQVGPPRGREVRVKILFNSICHSDLYALDGHFPVPYPCIVGHESSGIVESVGADVTWFKPGDYVIPTFMMQCRECRKCKRADTNFCEKYNFNVVNAPLDEGTPRITVNGQAVTPFLGTTSFSEYTVVMDRHLIKIAPDAPMEKICLLGCGFTTGYGSAVKTAQINKGDRVAVFGAGAVGLSAIHGAHKSGASEIFAVDLNPEKEKLAKAMGASIFVNPADCPENAEFVTWFVEKFGRVDRSLECIGNLKCMKNAIDITEVGWGRTVIVGVYPGKETLNLHPITFLEHKTVVGALYGDIKHEELIKLVDQVKNEEINLDPLITHKFDLADVNEAIELLRQGKAIRSIISLAKS